MEGSDYWISSFNPVQKPVSLTPKIETLDIIDPKTVSTPFKNRSVSHPMMILATAILAVSFNPVQKPVSLTPPGSFCSIPGRGRRVSTPFKNRSVSHLHAADRLHRAVHGFQPRSKTGQSHTRGLPDVSVAPFTCFNPVQKPVSLTPNRNFSRRYHVDSCFNPVQKPVSLTPRGALGSDDNAVVSTPFKNRSVSHPCPCKRLIS